MPSPFDNLEGERIQESLPAVMSWIACALNEREEAINWARDERYVDRYGDVPAPWLMIDGVTYKTYPEEADFLPSADLWVWIVYAGYFLTAARARICHMIGSLEHGGHSDTYNRKQIGGPCGEPVYDPFDPEHNAFYMAGDWRPWSSPNYPSAALLGATTYGSNIRVLLESIGYETGQWISEAYPVGDINWYVDTPIHDPRKWHQLRDAILALRWFRILSVPYLNKTREEIQITQGPDPDFSPYDIRGDYSMTTPVNTWPFMKISPNELYTKWEEAWDAMAADTVYEFAPLAGIKVVARAADNLDTPIWFDWKGYFRAEAVGKYTMKLGYLEDFAGTVVASWTFSWNVLPKEYLTLTDSFGNNYDDTELTTPPFYGQAVHTVSGDSLTLGIENTAELLSTVPVAFPFDIPAETDPTVPILNFSGIPNEGGGFISQGPLDSEAWIGLGTLTLKCEGSFS